MIKKKSIVKSILVVFFALLVLLPTIIKVAHHHKNHKPYSSHLDNNVHIDKNVVDFCEICSISTTPFNHLFFQTSDFCTATINKEKIVKEYSFIISFFVFSSKQLRAPPLYLS
ncbi:hypothetical protein [Polaribacter sargassicola]|uniref:hypothetical protein n=1 Tax=Polaribacter sargassicola TaxID=2836891 RepID=UPI001F3F89FD|nr:hypothetical protein [Polaribacter sp. DS7-9]MCG1037570.1 hypothetical protein [Polaribacter sp. DS7-9]